MNNSGKSILIDADNINIEASIQIETAYSLLTTFIDKYDYMCGMTNNSDTRAYHLVACANDIYYLIKAAWDILDHVREKNQKVQDLIGEAIDIVKEMQESNGEKSLQI